jgi:hypothetical protein
MISRYFHCTQSTSYGSLVVTVLEIVDVVSISCCRQVVVLQPVVAVGAVQCFVGVLYHLYGLSKKSTHQQQKFAKPFVLPLVGKD